MTRRRYNHSQVWSTPAKYHVNSDETVFTMFAQRARQHGRDTVMERRRDVGGWMRVNARTLLGEIDEVARGLLGMGLRYGDKLAIMSATRVEWTVLDMAALSLGIIVVPIYETDSLSQITHITRCTEPKLAVADTASRAELLQSGGHSTIKQVLCFESGAMRRIVEAGFSIADATLDAARREVDVDSVATIIYTSGTTGTSRGVVLTHRNFVATVYGVRQLVPQIIMNPKTRLLLFLPLAHVLARFVEIAALTGRAVIGHCPDTRNLLSDVETFQPSLLLLVPRVLEKIYNAAEAKSGAGVKRSIFRWAARKAIEYSQSLETTLGPSVKLRREHAWADRLVLKKIRKALGPNMTWVVSGGAPLSPELGHFFRGLGLRILEGWGLSETTGPMTLTIPGRERIGAVGPVLPGNEMTISSEGEILVRGSAVTVGYFLDPQATAEAMGDGWFHTGDLGTVDKDGNLSVTGRVKDLIVTAGGKNVSPASLEHHLVTHPLISHVVVVGDRRPFVGALITLDDSMLPTWLANHGLEPMDVAHAAHHPAVIASLDQAIERTNREVSRAESIRKFRIINAEFTVDNGYLTPSLKLKRAKVVNDFADEIDALYES